MEFFLEFSFFLSSLIKISYLSSLLDKLSCQVSLVLLDKSGIHWLYLSQNISGRKYRELESEVLIIVDLAHQLVSSRLASLLSDIN